MKKKYKYRRINGISLEDYASVCAHLAQGFSGSQIAATLGIDYTVWIDTLKKWNARLCKLISKDPNAATLYGRIFSSPKRGRFASGLYKNMEKEQLLLIVPDYDTFRKILWHKTVGREYGVDLVAILESYGLDIVKWSILYKHYMSHTLNQIGDETNRWKKYWRKYYAEIKKKKRTLKTKSI